MLFSNPRNLRGKIILGLQGSLSTGEITSTLPLPWLVSGFRAAAQGEARRSLAVFLPPCGLTPQARSQTGF